MKTNNSEYVFFMDCQDIGEAQVIKSFLEAQGLHPRITNEQTRTIASHLGQLIAKLTIEIPEYEYMAASQALENRQDEGPQIIEESTLDFTQGLAKKALWNSILGCIFIPVICNFYSMMLGYRTLKMEKPLSSKSRNYLMWSLMFNSLAFYIWLTLGPRYFFNNL